MALAPKLVRKCYRKIKGNKCDGNIVECRASPNVDVMIVGPGQFAGYKCVKCGHRYSTLPLDPRLEKKLTEKLRRAKRLTKKRRNKLIFK